MKWNKKFIYPASTRALINNQRHYDVNEEKLPSVTTILSATQSDEKKASLAKWTQSVGQDQATRIRDQAAERGSIMHRVLEGYLLGQNHADFSDLGQQAGSMANVILESGIRGHLDEIWGSEITVYYPGLYAGATDLAGIYDGRESIIDFKQSNKPKKKEWIEDYFMQLDQRISKDIDIDLSEAIMRLTRISTAYQASLQVGSQLLNTSLLNYL